MKSEKNATAIIIFHFFCYLCSMRLLPRHIATLLLMLMYAISVSAQSSHGRLSAWLQETIKHENQTKGSTAMKGVRRTEAVSMLATVFVQMREGMDDETLAQYGCKKYAQLGDIAIVTVPLDKIDSLSQHPEVLRVEANDKAHPTMDTVPGITNLLPLYQQTEVHPAFTGQGVVLGLMDVGFDLTHPTFYNDTTLSEYRIKAFWDQLAPFGNNDCLPVGCEWTTAEDILLRQCATDGYEQSHGTHTLGIAAGSGYDSPYRGVAWGSDICLVANAVTADTAFIDKSNYYLYTTATDALGFKYLFDYADSQHKPCVVSFSEGYSPYMDNDDYLLHLFLSRLVGPGRILVASAGNERQEMTYFNKPLGVECAGSFIRVYRPTVSYRIQADGHPIVRLIAYQDKDVVDNELRLPLDNDRWEDDMLIDTLFLGGRGEGAEVRDTCAVSIFRYPTPFVEGKTIYQIQLSANRSLNNLEHIAMVLEGTDSEAEVFGSSTCSFGNYDTDIRWNAAEKSHNVLSPGCFETVITVGSTSHRQSYTNINGNMISDTRDPEAGHLSWYSSVGPTIDGLTKPDVTAPGKNIVSSLSSQYYEKYPDATSSHVKHFDLNGRTYVWGMSTGTSMSTPVVAGTIALWLEAKPTLTPDDIRGILQRTCKHPEGQLSYPNNLYGYGEIDAYEGLLDILGITGIQELSHHQPQGVRITASNGQLHLLFAQKPSEPILLSIYATSGALLHRQWLRDISQDMTLPLPIQASGIYAVQLTSKDKAVTGSQLVRN